MFYQANRLNEVRRKVEQAENDNYYKLFLGGTANFDETDKDWSIELSRGTNLEDAINFFSIVNCDGKLTARISSSNPAMIVALREEFPFASEGQFQMISECREFQLNGIKEIDSAIKIVNAAKTIPSHYHTQIKDKLKENPSAAEYYKDNILSPAKK